MIYKLYLDVSRGLRGKMKKTKDNDETTKQGVNPPAPHDRYTVPSKFVPAPEIENKTSQSTAIGTERTTNFPPSLNSTQETVIN